MSGRPLRSPSARRVALALAVCSVTTGCSSGDDWTSEFRTKRADAPREDAPVVFAPADEAGAEPVATTDCSAEAKLVYVVSAENDLYSFHPGELRFRKIGPLGCTTSATANSMAVDRQGIAWVNMTNGEIHKVDVRDASCTRTAFQPPASGFGERYGMGFSTLRAEGASEVLYVSSLNGQGLARLDTQSLQLVPIGGFGESLGDSGAELTGTGDGRLFGFFNTKPNATLSAIAKNTARASDARVLAGVATGTHWAFSFWGGAFYLYTADSSQPGTQRSRVTRIVGETGASQVVLADVGFRIVGAGVSTCAPVLNPR
jgi:hypothetical protein